MSEVLDVVSDGSYRQKAHLTFGNIMSEETENKIKSIACYVLPFNVNTQFFYHMMLGLDLHTAFTLTWIKYHILDTNNKAVTDLKLESIVKEDEIQHFAFDKHHHNTVMSTYVIETDQNLHITLYQHVKRCTVTIPNEYSYITVSEKFIPEHIISDKDSLGSVSKALDSSYLNIAREYFLHGMIYNQRNLINDHWKYLSLSIDSSTLSMVTYIPFIAFKSSFFAKVLGKNNNIVIRNNEYLSKFVHDSVRVDFPWNCQLLERYVALFLKVCSLPSVMSAFPIAIFIGFDVILANRDSFTDDILYTSKFENEPNATVFLYLAGMIDFLFCAEPKTSAIMLHNTIAKTNIVVQDMIAKVLIPKLQNEKFSIP